MKDLCTCGNEKDARSKKCRACFLAINNAETKVCTICKIEKPVSEFRIRTRATPRPRSHCLECERKSQLGRYAKDPVKHYEIKKRSEARQTPERKARNLLRQKVNALKLDLDEVKAYIEEHHGKCEICGTEPTKNNLSLDHCHETGKFRGLLCSECNLALGKFKDSPERLQAAIAYLTKER